MSTINNLDPSRRLQFSNRPTIHVPPPPRDPKGVHRKPQPSRRGYITQRHRFVVGKLVENVRNGRGQPMGQILRAAGYSDNVATKPTHVTQSLGFQELLEQVMPDDDLSKIHKSLLASKKLDHMTFPLGPEGDADPFLSGATPETSVADQAGIYVERTTLSDVDIKQMIAEVGGTVRRIVHGDTARHVYFWAPNDKTRHDALKLAYDLKGYIGKKGDPEAPPGGNTFNMQVNMVDSAPRGRQLAQTFTDFMLQQTAKKAPDPS